MSVGRLKALMLEPIDWPRLFLGLPLFLAPGFAWTWALLGNLPWPYRVPVAMVAAFTIMPATAMALHLVLSVPLSLQVFVFTSAFHTLAGGAFWASRHAPQWDLDRLVERRPAAVVKRRPRS